MQKQQIRMSHDEWEETLYVWSIAEVQRTHTDRKSYQLTARHLHQAAGTQRRTLERNAQAYRRWTRTTVTVVTSPCLITALQVSAMPAPPCWMNIVVRGATPLCLLRQVEFEALLPSVPAVASGIRSIACPVFHNVNGYRNKALLSVHLKSSWNKMLKNCYK